MQGIITNLLLVATICMTCSKASLQYESKHPCKQEDYSDRTISFVSQQNLPKCGYCQGEVDKILSKTAFICCLNVNDKKVIHVRCILPAIDLSFNLESMATSVPSADIFLANRFSAAQGSNSTSSATGDGQGFLLSRRRLYPFQNEGGGFIGGLSEDTKRPKLSKQFPLLNRLLDDDTNRFSVEYTPPLARNSAFVYCSCSTCSNDVIAGFIHPLEDSINAIKTNDSDKFMELMQANYPLKLAMSTMSDVDESTGLMLASKQGNLPIVRWLSSHGSNVTGRNRANKTALDYAESRAVRDLLTTRYF